MTEFRKILLLSLLFSFNQIMAQDNKLIPYRIGDLWGFCDSTMKCVIDARFIKASPFKNNYAWVSTDNARQYMINQKGKEIISTEYDEYFDFRDGLARVQSNGKWGFVDTSGVEVIKTQYPRISDFYNHRAWFWDNTHCGMINRNGDTMAMPIYDGYITYGNKDIYIVKKDGKMGIIDTNGNELIPAIYDKIGQGFRHNLCDVALNGKFGFIDRKGNVVIPLEYEFVWVFVDGVACAKKHGKFGLIDTNNVAVVPFIYDAADDFCNENRFGVCKNWKWGFVDTKNNTVIPFVYYRIGSFNHFGVAIVSVLQDKFVYYTLIDLNGHSLFPDLYSSISHFNSAGFAKVRSGNNEGVIDYKGSLIIPLAYDRINIGYNNVAIAKKGNKYGYIDLATGEIIIEFYYDCAYEFVDGIARVCRYDKWFYIDKRGKEYFSE